MPSPPKPRIALILPLADEYAVRLAEGALDYAGAHPEIEVVCYSYRMGAEDPLQDRELDFAGAVVWLSHSDCWAQRLLDAGKVLVTTGGDWPTERIPKVGFDAAEVTAIACDYLLGLGRPHAAFIGWQTSLHPALVRLTRLFEARCRDAGVSARVYETATRHVGSDRLAKVPAEVSANLTEFLAALPTPAVVWAEDDFMARLICDLAAQAGLAVPGDLAVLGIGDRLEARMRRPAISTIPYPGQLVGREMIKTVHDLLCGRQPASPMGRIPPPPVLVRESTQADVPDDTPLQHAYQWIRRHACEGGTVNELLERVPMSPWTFSKRFAEMFGRTPGEEIRHVRLEQARHQLRTTQLSVSEIANLCGYDHPAKFSNFFKRETGMTPSAYRANKGPA